MRTRFKYVPVPPQTYSLDPVEILLATDQELNEYMSIKKYAPYRQKDSDRSKWDPRQQEKLRALKDRIRQRWDGPLGGSSPRSSGPSGANSQPLGGDGERPKKKRMGKKERMKLKEAGRGEDGGQNTKEAAENAPKSAPAAEKPQAKKRKREEEQEPATIKIPAAVTPAVESEAAKRRKRRKRAQARKEGGGEEA